MKQFFWKFFICAVPCILAGIAVTDATIKYRNGNSGGFKLGVDLVGGTILVYEIDLTKNVSSDSKFDPSKDTTVLADALKRRIDPNDLYNITIRPAGGEGRIEIILPTGGTHRAKKAEEVWQQVLTEMKDEYLKDVPGAKLEVGRGKVLELADKIQSIRSADQWQKQLFSSPQGWQRLIDAAGKYWAVIDNKKALREELDSIPTGDMDAFQKFILESLAYTESPTSQKTLQNWIKSQAWTETMTLARQQWKFLEPAKEDMERINPDHVDQLTTFILAKGLVVGQATLALLNPLVGDNIDRAFTDDSPNAKQVRDFIEKHYGTPVQTIVAKINDRMKESGLGKDLSIEEVQRIKDLVTKVGSLEFRILANLNDDAEAIKDAKKAIEESRNALEDLAKGGLPPPGPKGGDGKLRRYKIPTKGSPSYVTYSWVELGPQERRSLNLDNAARTDSQRNAAWYQAAQQRNFATHLTFQAGATEKMLQGALFYSRECKDRNLPEEERRQKEIEYFVLTRDPEFEDENSEIRKPKIDGSYLTNAQARQGDDLRPTVAFSFNNEGGNLFGNITRKNVSDDSGPENTKIRRHLAIILDGMVMSAPTINSEIRTQGVISGNFTQKEVDSLVNILRAGRLPATLKPQPVSESTIAATLGEDTIEQGVRAILYSFAAVLVFMVIYYRFAGLVASVALMANLLLTVGFMVAVKATFTLSGLAGIVLTLGMAVDANILIYERLREERERGASLLQAIRNGYDRALPTIIDTHLSSIFTAIVLYVVGNDNLKGFAISMTVGLIISLFTSLYMTRVLFDFWQARGWLTKLTMMRFFAKPDIDFMSVRYLMFGGTLVFSLAGLALFIGRIPNDLNIDFIGGTAYGGKLTRGIAVTELRKKVEEHHQKQVLEGVTVKEEEGSQGRRFAVTFPKTKETRTLVFSHIPEGATPADREAKVQKRATLLAEPSVEMLYNASNDPDVAKELDKGLSRNFVIRTTEKEAELVQAILDQLLRDEDGSQLLAKVFARRDRGSRAAADEGIEVRLHFFKNANDTKDPDKIADATASPSFVKTLLNRELRRAYGYTEEKTQLPFHFDVNGEGNNDSDGKFSVVKVTVSKGFEMAKLESALDATINAFAARPQPDRLENFDSTLASETRFRAMWAVLASWTAILVYLWFRFGNWTFGLAAVLCLVHDLFFTLGAIAAAYFVHGTVVGDFLRLDDFKLDLPGVAALLTLVGYSVNDTIVVFDRIREVRGKNPDLTPKMINDSINQTLSRTLLASLTVWLVVFVLYIFGGPGVHLFAYIMVIGVIVGTYSSIYIASPLLLMFGEGTHGDTAQTQTKSPTPTAEGAVV